MNVAGVLLLALVDSINPSAIVVTLSLLSIARSRVLVQVAVYIAAIFVTYLLFGAMMVLGIEWLLPSFGQALDSRAGLIVQCLVGLALLVFGLTGPTGRPSSQVAAPPSASTYAALVMLGITVTVMELPTAIPYLAAIALISEAELPVREWAPLLVVYNVIFVLPPIALLVGHLVLQKRLAGAYVTLRQRLESGARATMLWIAGLVGGALFVTSAIELLARLR